METLENAIWFNVVFYDARVSAMTNNNFCGCSNGKSK